MAFWPDAARAYGLSRACAYDLHAKGTFPVPVRRLGRLLRVVTADLLTDLGGSAAAHATEDGAAVSEPAERRLYAARF